VKIQFDLVVTDFFSGFSWEVGFVGRYQRLPKVILVMWKQLLIGRC